MNLKAVENCDRHLPFLENENLTQCCCIVVEITFHLGAIFKVTNGQARKAILRRHERWFICFDNGHIAKKMYL